MSEENDMVDRRSNANENQGDIFMRDGDEVLAVKVATAARMLSVDRTTLYRWKKLGLISMAKVNGTTLIPMGEIKRLVSGQGSA